MLLAFLAVLAWGIGVAFLLEGRVHAWFLDRGRDRPGRTALLVLGTHLATLVGWVLVAVVGRAIAGDDHPARAGWVVVPWLLAYLPWLVQFVPSQVSGFRSPRRDAQDAGMSRATARAFFWTGAPFAVLGLTLVVSALFATLAS